jgi:hypothetical protein
MIGPLQSQHTAEQPFGSNSNRQRAMSENLPKLAVETFSTILQLKLQQTQSMLRGRVMEGQHVGKQASPGRLHRRGADEGAAGRYSPNQPQSTDFTRRWVLPVDKEAFQLIDTFDKLRLLTDPTSQYAAVAAAAVAREWDDRIIAAAFATATIGDSTGIGTTTEAFRPVGSVRHLQVRGIFRPDRREDDRSQAHHAQGAGADRHRTADLGHELAGRKRSAQSGAGRVQRVQRSPRAHGRQGHALPRLGHRLQRAPGLLVEHPPEHRDGEVRRLPRHLEGHENSHLDRRTDLSGLPWQLATLMSSGATRLEPGRLLQVLCADTSAAADVTP